MPTAAKMEELRQKINAHPDMAILEDCLSRKTFGNKNQKIVWLQPMSRRDESLDGYFVMGIHRDLFKYIQGELAVSGKSATARTNNWTGKYVAKKSAEIFLLTEDARSNGALQTRRHKHTAKVFDAFIGRIQKKLDEPPRDG